MSKKKLKLISVLTCFSLCGGIIFSDCWENGGYSCGEKTLSKSTLLGTVSCTTDSINNRNGTYVSKVGLDSYISSDEECYWACTAYDIFGNSYSLTDSEEVLGTITSGSPCSVNN